MRARVWLTNLMLVSFAVACGDQPTEVVPEREGGMAQGPGTVALATASNGNGLSITTDKDDYAPEDTVWLTGTGWTAGDTVDIVLTDDPTHDYHTWSVEIAEDGTFRDSTYVVDINDLGVTFTLTATSRTNSEQTLTVVFYDFNLASAFINAVDGSGSQGGTVHSDGSFTITAGATRTNTGGNVTIPTWAGTSYAFNTTNAAPSSGSFVCLSPAVPSPGVPVTATASPGTFGGSMTIPTTGLARGTQYLFIRAHPIATCTGSSSSASAAWQLDVDGPDLTIAKTHTAADFVRGADASYIIKVQNVGEDATSGTITVTDNLPNNLTPISLSGTGWSCTLATLTCTRAAALASQAFADDITLVVTVEKTGSANVTNVATVSGGGDNNPGNNEAQDPTVLISAPPTQLKITSSAFSVAFNTCSPVITVQTRNQFNQPVRPDANVLVNLTSTSGGGTFYTTDDCSGSAVAQVTIPSTDFKVNFYYKDSVCGTPTIKAKDNVNPGLGEDTQQETITGCPTNTAPTAAFVGAPYSTDEGSVKQVDGSASSDPEDGTDITYLWSIDVTANTSPYVPIDAGGGCLFYTTNDASDAGTATSTLDKPYVKCTDNGNGDGVYKLTLVVTDKGTPPLSSTPAETQLTVKNVAPTITAVTVSPSVAGYIYSILSQPTIGATYTDPGSNDTHTCRFEVYDYLNVEVGADRTCGAGLGVVEAGVYDVKVTVTDDDGGADDETVQIVVYDPSAGFVTGGGWINSAPGAYKDDMALYGKATFGFVSKYLKGATVPTGNTQFVFHAENAAGSTLDFHSTFYEWLVVNGAGTRAQYKGAGKVEGRADTFTFMLTANDGSPDRFRIQIFRPDGTTLYDNYVSGPATEQALGGGSIVIHVPKK